MAIGPGRRRCSASGGRGCCAAWKHSAWPARPVPRRRKREGFVRYPQLIIHEGDGRLTALLRPLAEERKWSMRESPDTAECLDRLRRGGPAVVVLKVGRDLERELTLLEEVRRRRPEASVVVVGEAVHAPLIGLA